MDLNKEIQGKVYKLFEEGKITRFIGYEQGSLPYKTRPCFINKKEDVKRLIFNPFCVNNLSVYLKQYYEEKTGILAHPCTLRSIVALRQGNQIKPENVYILAVNCELMIDPDKIPGLRFLKVNSWEIRGDKFIMRTADGDKEHKLSDVIYDRCGTCGRELPKIYNELIGEERKQPPASKDEYAIIKELEKLSPEERWKYWEKEFSKCIRCYACRNVCPVCYCRECIVDKTMPQWVSKVNQPSTNEYYNLIRVLHVMGRCVDCGECERVCPAKIPYRKLLKKMEKEIKELYGYVPGYDPAVPPPLSTHKEEDSEEGIK